MIWKEAVTIGKRTIELESGKLARQANGAVVVRDGNTVILCTAVGGPPGENLRDFLPLTVDYREYQSAAGKIPGGFLKRESRNGTHEVLSSRICDRSLRPLFPKSYQAETQIMATVLSYDPESDPAVLAIIGAAAALHISDIPWNGPLAALRIARSQGETTVFPTPAERERAELEMTLSLSPEGVVMIEGGARQVPDGEIVEVIGHAGEQAAGLLRFLDAMKAAIGKEKMALPPVPPPPPFATRLEELARPALREALAEADKLLRRDKLRQAQQQVLVELEPELSGEGAPAQAAGLLQGLAAQLLRSNILEQGLRVDGRGPEEIRTITTEVDWLPSTHGSALFTRGETQAMVTLTLGSHQDRLMSEQLGGLHFERFMLQYHFPPYSVGETKPQRGPSRREVGHGTLAQRALRAVLPLENEFPYSMRLISEISESNGSSSMATICGGSLALMDGGVPLAAPVAGIAMGLVKEGDKHVILRDILGDEDHLGDMDFKVAGTSQGVTAVQMDNKLGSLPAAVMAEAFEQARQGRLHILAEMAKTLAQPNEQVKDHVPLHDTMTIATNRVRDLIGPGGKVIQEIQRKSACKLEVDDQGVVRIYAPNRQALQEVRATIMEKAGSLEVDAVYEGTIINIKDFGAFVRIRGQDGLVHRSEWAFTRVENMYEVANVGDKIKVKLLEPDHSGRLSLSRKAAL